MGNGMSDGATIAEPVVRCADRLGEGTTWAPGLGRLLWVDIEGAELRALDPRTGRHEHWAFEERIATVAERAGGGLVAAFASGFATIELPSGRVERLAGVETGGRTRLNDGRCDRQGRFVVGAMDEADPREPKASVWRLDVGAEPETVMEGVRISNSICFSPDGATMYFTDTPEKVIWAYDYDVETGRPGARRMLVDLTGSEGAPDGSTVDAASNLWNAEWGASRVVRYRPDGGVDRVVAVPTAQPSCVALGGEGLGRLYVSSARYGMSEAQLRDDPLAGALFATEVDVPGLPETPFGG